jgi:FkbM family methyltransferase
MISFMSLHTLVRNFRALLNAVNWTPHDQQWLNFYTKFISPGDICFDIGANIGAKSKILLRAGAKVIAVEPQDECVRIPKILKLLYRRRFDIVHMACGAEEAEAEMLICNASTLSSLSREWICAVINSGRFASFSWKKKKLIKMTTLDRLICKYGLPNFIKVDTEGFEYEVIRGLSQPVKLISLEFTPEYLAPIIKSIQHLQSFGEIRYNFAIAEVPKLVLGEWVTAEKIINILKNFSGNKKIYGDVYFQFIH